MLGQRLVGISGPCDAGESGVADLPKEFAPRIVLRQQGEGWPPRRHFERTWAAMVYDCWDCSITSANQMVSHDDQGKE